MPKTTSRMVGLLAELREERARLVAAVAQMDHATAALELLVKGTGTAASNGRNRARRKPASRRPTMRRKGMKRATAKPARRKLDARVDGAVLDRARALYDRGEKPPAIAKACGVPVGRIYGWKYRYEWEKPAPAKPGTDSTSTREGYTETPRRRCGNEDCGKITTSDPCAHCGEKWANRR